MTLKAGCAASPAARSGPFRRDGRRVLANGRKIAVFSKSESTETGRCGGGSGLASSLPKARAAGDVTGMAEPAGILGFVGKQAASSTPSSARRWRRSSGSLARATVLRWSRAGALRTWRSLPPASVSKRLGGIGARPCLVWSGAEPHRFPAACADRRSAQHSPDGAGDAMVRSARPCRRAVSGGGAEGHRGDGVGSVMPALPRCEVPRQPTSRTADRRALLLLQHRLRTQFQPQRRADLPSRALDWPLPDGEMCVLGQGSARHVKFQGDVAAQSAGTFDLSLAPGPTVFGPSRPARKWTAKSARTASSRRSWRAAVTFCSKGRMQDELAIRNESDRPLSSSSRTATGPRTR